MKVALAIALAAGCGRVGFTDQSDAGTTRDGGPDAPPGPPLLVGVGNASSPSSANKSMLTVTPAPTTDVAPPNVVVVGVTLSGTSVTVSNVTDSQGNTYTSAQARGALSGAASELWSARVAALPASVTVQLNGPTGFDAWVVAYSGITTASPYVDAANAACSMTPAIAVASVTTTKANEPVFGVTMLSTWSVMAVGAPFMSLNMQRGNGAAYGYPVMPGIHGPHWTASGTNAGGVCSSTLALLPL